MRQHADRNPASCFFGVLVPDEPEFHGPAFSRAGLMFQEGLLGGLDAAGFRPDAVYSIEPVPAIPRSRRLFGKTGQYVTPRGLIVRVLPFINVQPLKWLTAGLSVLTTIVRWSWRHRRKRRAVQCLNLTMPPGLFVWLGARLTRSKAIVWVLDVFEPGILVRDSLFRRIDFALQRWLLPRFDGVMVVSQAIASDFVPGKRVCRNEGGVSPELFDGFDRRRAEREGPFRIVLSGSLEMYNGIALALDALAKLPSGYELVVAGAGSFAGRLREISAGDRRLMSMGFLDFNELLALYASADLLLNLRLTKSLDTKYFFPSKLMELLASGTPVLSTCTGHVREEYGHVLYLLEDETAEALVARVMAIAAMPRAQRLALGARARAFVLSEKSWQRQGERLATYIKNVVFEDPPAAQQAARAPWSR
jgi:glycosyltransferase involved in cell wall biosynthesis